MVCTSYGRAELARLRVKMPVQHDDRGEVKLRAASIWVSVLVDIVIVVDLGCRSVVVFTVAANGRQWCPLPQEPKLLGGTLVAISSRPATLMLVRDKQPV